MTVQTAVPRHIAIVMDGNGRWANAQGLTRIEGHKAGEVALLDVVAGAIEAGVKYLTVFAFSTENWKRSPEEVRFLMGYNVEVLRRRRDQLNAWGVRIRWAGRRPKLWSSVIRELQAAEELTAKNKTLTLTMCVNYGSRIEMVDAMNQLSQDVADGKLQPGKITEKTITQYLNSSFLPDVDLFCVRVASSAFRTFCCGKAPTPNWSSTKPHGLRSIDKSCGRRFQPSRPVRVDLGPR